MSQLFRLLKLAPEVLADLEDEEGVGPVPREVELRKLAGVKSPERMFAQYQRLCGEAAGRGPRRGATRGRPPQKGLQHLFVRARRYYAAMEAGTFESLGEVGRAEGVTGARIRQILLLLQLEAEIMAAVDVPVEELPQGVTDRRLREVAKLRGREAQLVAWDALLKRASTKSVAGPD